MRRIRNAGFAALFVVSSALWGIAQEKQAAPQSNDTQRKSPMLSQERITEEQAAIYRAFLKSWAKGSGPAPLNVSSQTEALEIPDEDLHQPCL